MRNAPLRKALLLVASFGIGATVALGQSGTRQHPVKRTIQAKLPVGFSVPKSTWSPNGRYGVLVPDIDHEREDASQNAIIDLKTGAIIGTIRGQTGNSSGGRGGANPSRWSSDSSLLLWEVEGKWNDQALVLIRICNGKIVSQWDIECIGEQALRARTKRVLRKHEPARADYGVVDVKVNGEAGTPISLPLKVHAELTSDPKMMHPDTNVESEMNALVSASGKVTITHFKMYD